MARAQINPNAICTIEQSRRRMLPEEFEKEYPNVGPCSDKQFDIEEFKRRKIYGENPQNVANNPDGKVVHTRSGQTLIYSCANHANIVRQTGAAIERFLQYIRPELNSGESINATKRMKERESRDANKETNQTNKLVKRKTKEKTFKDKRNTTINLFSPEGEEFINNIQEETKNAPGKEKDLDQTESTVNEEPQENMPPVANAWDNLEINNDEED
jgi:hypothetical protein